MLKSLYDWTMDRISRPSGERWLLGFSVIEAVFFPIPVDAMLVPMILADHKKAWRLAAITTIGSIIGALLGYLMGMFLFDQLAGPMIDFYGYGDKFSDLQAKFQAYGIWIVLIGGLTPIPFKLVAVSAGAFALNPLLFVLLCLPARAPRFFVVAALLYKFGPAIRDFIEKRLGLVFTLGMILFVGGYGALKFL